ncbi:MAG: RidA family protein [Hyphomicrobiaceae bacterium]
MTARDDIGFHEAEGIKRSAAFSHAVVADGLVHVSGQIAADREGSDGVPPGDIAAETRAVMEQIGMVLAGLGLDHGDIVSVRVHMTDLREFEAMNRVYRGFFAEGRMPARTTVGVAAILEGCRIEIDCVARLRAAEARRD